LLMNLFATPGLGSLMGGRLIAGLGQLFLFLIGFVFITYWFIKTMKEYYSLMGEDVPIHVSYGKYFLAGFLFAAASWLWSLMTSIRMVHQAKPPEPAPPGASPPKIV
jgi:hypothetical protein